MNLKYKILEVRPDQHSIIVRFYTDKITEEMLVMDRDLRTGAITRCRSDRNIDLPVPAPTGEDLHVYIITRAPQDWLAMLEKIEDPTVDTSMVELQSLIGQEVVTPIAGA